MMLSRDWELIIDSDLRKFSEMAIKGIIAHELAHIVQFRSMGILKKVIYVFFWETKMEREADEMVVNKGFTKELLQFVREHDKKYEEIKAHEGLTKKELKIILKYKDKA